MTPDDANYKEEVTSRSICPDDILESCRLNIAIGLLDFCLDVLLLILQRDDLRRELNIYAMLLEMFPHDATDDLLSYTKRLSLEVQMQISAYDLQQ